jgi:hypothetical protein
MGGGGKKGGGRREGREGEGREGGREREGGKEGGREGGKEREGREGGGPRGRREVRTHQFHHALLEPQYDTHRSGFQLLTQRLAMIQQYKRSGTQSNYLFIQWFQNLHFCAHHTLHCREHYITITSLATSSVILTWKPAKVLFQSAKIPAHQKYNY